MKKKNLWPFAIISIFIVFICATISLVVLACSQKQDLVSADYYEQEIRFQDHLERLDRAHHTLHQPSIDYDLVKRLIKISLSPEPGAHVTGEIQLYRPSAAGLDRNFKLALDAQGVQSLDTASLSPGLWKVRVSWMTDNKQYFFERNIVITGKGLNSGPAQKIS